MVLLVYFIIRITVIYTFKVGRSNTVLITILQFVHILNILLTQLPKLKPMIEGSVRFVINYLIRTSYTIGTPSTLR